MIKNISKTKSTFRLLAGVTLLALFISHVLTGTTGLIMFSLSGVLLVSGLFRSCPVTYYARKNKHFSK